MERWQSGLMQRSWKPSRGRPLPEFESLPLRHKTKAPDLGLLFYDDKLIAQTPGEIVWQGWGADGGMPVRRWLSEEATVKGLGQSLFFYWRRYRSDIAGLSSRGRAFNSSKLISDAVAFFISWDIIGFADKNAVSNFFYFAIFCQWFSICSKEQPLVSGI